MGADTGVALVEAYDADADAATSRTRKLVNIATRGQVSSGDNVLIAGLVVTGPGPRTYLIRAVGPTLGGAPFSVGGALSDPFCKYSRTRRCCGRTMIGILRSARNPRYGMPPAESARLRCSRRATPQ